MLTDDEVIGRCGVLVVSHEWILIREIKKGERKEKVNKGSTDNSNQLMLIM